MSERAAEFARPRRLEPGMTIGVIAPSSALRDERLEPGIALLEGSGYRVVRGDHLYDRHGFLAGPAALRAADLTSMFARPDVDAVFCARGGYGAWGIVDLIDWNAVRSNPKVFVGYSDVTTLHLALERRAGLATFHGPMVVTHGGRLSQTAADCFWRMISCAEPPGEYHVEPGSVRLLVGGRTAGRLAGGCLSLLAAAVGTRDQPDFTGRIVAIEDVGESLPHVDRHLTQLGRSGLLAQAAGYVLGTVTDWEKDAGEDPPITLDDVWRAHFLPLGKPTIVGFPFGHVEDPLTIPLGCHAELEADAARLTVTESAVR